MSQKQLIIGNSDEGVAAAATTAYMPRLRISTEAWIKIGTIGALFVCLFWPNLRRLWDKTNPFYGEANWGHAICIPLIGFYFLYVNRQQLLNPSPLPAISKRSEALWVWGMLTVGLGLPLVLVREVATSIFIPGIMIWAAFSVVVVAICLWQQRSALLESTWQHSAGWFGILILLFGIELVAYAIYPGQNDFLKDFGMVIALLGVVLAVAGWGVMRIAWFPIAFLVCGIPWPGLMYSRIASPLQQLAARAAVWTLEMTGVESSSWGTKIFIQGHGGVVRTLNVAEACAGLRSLMTFVSVGAAVAFLSQRPLWQKIIITVSAIPIAIFCNVMRVSGQGLLDHYVSQQLSEDFAHQFVGMIMLIPAFLLILLVGWLLDQIFVEQVDDRQAPAPAKIVRRVEQSTPVVVAAKSTGRTLAEIRGTAAPAPRPPTKLSPPPPTVRLASRPPPPAENPASKNPATGGRPPTPPQREAI